MNKLKKEFLELLRSNYLSIEVLGKEQIASSMIWENDIYKIRKNNNIFIVTYAYKKNKDVRYFKILIEKIFNDKLKNL